MRVIDHFELQQSASCRPPDGGGEIYSINLPLGWNGSVSRESNNTYTINVKNAYGADVYTANTGAGAVCTAAGGGVALTVYGFSRGNPRLAGIAYGLVSQGCSMMLDDSWEDGDESGLPEC